MKIIIICFLLSVLVEPVSAATFSVDQGGGGDFLVIQDAVNAAASGDTILIGPGRFNEGAIVSTPGWTEFVRVLISQEELTLIGSGADVSIIGPEEPYSFSQGGHRGIEAGPYFGNQRIWVSNLGFENMRHGIGGAPVPEINVSNCRFDGNYFGIFSIAGESLVVRDCQFSFSGEDGTLLYTNSMNSAQILNCDFELLEDQIGHQVAVQFDTTLEVDVVGCNFFEGRHGAIFSGTQGSIARLQNCSFYGQSRRGLSIIGCLTTIENCNFEQQEAGVYISHYSTDVSVFESVFNEIGLCSFLFSDVGQLNVENCILERGERFVIKEENINCQKSDSSGLPLLLMENNDWGTVEADSIASWIRLCSYDVDFIPFVGQPVPTESPTLGGMKSLFR